jgi:hypothetical protein
LFRPRSVLIFLLQLGLGRFLQPSTSKVGRAISQQVGNTAS